MGDLIEFPERKPPPATGYCTSCGVEMPWASMTAWPTECLNGCSPLILSSWPKEDAIVVTSGAGTVIWTFPE